MVSQFGEAVSDGKFRAAVPDSEPDEGAVNPWLADQISKSAAEAAPIVASPVVASPAEAAPVEDEDAWCVAASVDTVDAADAAEA